MIKGKAFKEQASNAATYNQLSNLDGEHPWHRARARDTGFDDLMKERGPYYPAEVRVVSKELPEPWCAVVLACREGQTFINYILEDHFVSFYKEHIVMVVTKPIREKAHGKEDTDPR